MHDFSQFEAQERWRFEQERRECFAKACRYKMGKRDATERRPPVYLADLDYMAGYDSVVRNRIPLGKPQGFQS